MQRKFCPSDDRDNTERSTRSIHPNKQPHNNNLDSRQPTHNQKRHIDKQRGEYSFVRALFHCLSFTRYLSHSTCHSLSINYTPHIPILFLRRHTAYTRSLFSTTTSRTSFLSSSLPHQHLTHANPLFHNISPHHIRTQPLHHFQLPNLFCQNVRQHQLARPAPSSR